MERPKGDQGAVVAICHASPDGRVSVFFLVSFSTSAIRVVAIDGNPWFLGTDVYKAMGFVNSGNAYARLAAEQKTNIRQVDVGMSGGRDAPLISESGLYRLVMRSWTSGNSWGIRRL